MKRLLSIILATALLISIAPSAFATIDATTGLNKQTYTFTTSVAGATDFAGGITVSKSESSDAYSLLRWGEYNSIPAFTGTSIKYVSKQANANTGVILFAIEVDKKGTYIPSVKYETNERGGYLQVYVMNEVSKLTSGSNAGSETDTALFKDITTKYADNVLKTDLSLDAYYSGAVRGNVSNIINTAGAAEIKTHTFENSLIELEAGTNYVAFVLNGASNGADAKKAGRAMFYTASFSLQEIETVVEPPKPDNGAVVFGFDAESTGNGSTTTKGVTMASGDYTKSIRGGCWEHIEDNLKNAAIYGTYAKWTTRDGHNVSPETPAYLTLKITVDKSGTYTPSIECESRSRGGHLKIFIVNEEAYAGFNNIYANKKPLDNKFIDTYSTDAEYKVHTFKNVTLEAGTYYLIFAIDGIDSAATNTAQEHIKNFTLTPAPDAPSNSVSYCETSNLPNAKMSIRSLTRGASVTVSATEVEGYTFRAWVRGSADNGNWVSSDMEYTFSPMTHTMLTAVYTKNNESSDEKLIEYYNENGEYIETKTTEEASPTPTKLVGYEFDDWYVGDGIKLALDSITNALTRAVAKHNVEDSEYTISYNGNASYKYDEQITLTSPEAVCWLRDGKAVDYGTTYTFYVWDDTTVTTKSGDDSPKVMLDTPKGNSRMIEYDAGNGDIIEAGIIFGDSSSITIDSCSEKMISQRLSDHGQFTATSECSVARGYIIYKNINGGLEIVYAD